MSREAVKAATSAANAISVHKKYTVQSTGIWERLRRVLAIDANRSTGVPLNPQFRNPTPGALPPLSYDDPVTVPAADIADNPYWKRDARRNYPKLSVVNQGDAVGLLTVGSKQAPKEDILQIGEAGEKQLVSIKQEGEDRGLAAIFEKDKSNVQGVLGSDGLPPLPTKLNTSSEYQLGSGQGYPEKYPCRTFV
ncbi:putative NADH-ubiquinone oxidoreductase 21 kDa subunit [Talaromyces proteolyticus]|uniref:NADH-ubiquinone oxidoreductase 21 kDa subunit n=1 Tax=Talaromyces proteolyticus TaxID=1131652 RepID=A0AAD4KIN0_9EURO|nr:putative NADH-ubiquinone oxidoreductase 21 kDa subunit [Talaromyces proteolyticus]KAH8693113.1 putative NADH-ubiquinone oxidoreductase 21 kDa subunit [Talaromyces proteolyticus]